MAGRLGIVLAAGAGRRMGVPKGLLCTSHGDTWAAHAARVLLAAGCERVLVVVGARGSEVAAALPHGVAVVTADRWAEGMGESLRAGLLAARDDAAEPDAVVVHLVDVPGVTAEAVARTLGAAGAGDAVLARAAYRGQPGHPVVIGRRHWGSLLAEIAGDRGAGGYLAGHGAFLVECGDVADGRDVDTPGERPAADARHALT